MKNVVGTMGEQEEKTDKRERERRARADHGKKVEAFHNER